MRKRLPIETWRWPPTRLNGSKSKLIDIISVLLVGLGVGFWIWPVQTLRSQAGGFAQADVMLRSLVFIFLATQLTTVGVAFYAYSLSMRKAREEDEEPETTLDGLEASLNQQNRDSSGSTPTIRLDLNSLRRSRPRRIVSRIHLLAVVEGIVVLLLYGWLVAEFKANLYMQGWVRNNIPLAAYLLNDYFLVLLVGLMAGILLSQLRVLRTRSTVNKK